jgi:PTH1 family peptidyl-tRNA hydrolase
MLNNKIRLIVGLGNYEDKYLKDRHNVGFMAIDEFADKLQIRASAWQNKFNGRFAILDNPYGCKDTIEKIILLKPCSYMNLSGKPVQSLVSYYKITPENIVVIHDELDLTPGKLRIKLAGGTAGHNGLKSISQNIGPDYWRIRIGIGHPGSRELVANYVLNKPTQEEKDLIDQSINKLVNNLEKICIGDLKTLTL